MSKSRDLSGRNAVSTVIMQLKHSTHFRISLTLLLLRDDEVVGTIEQPSMIKDGVTVVGVYSFSGMKSDISKNFYAKICATSLAGIGGRPGHKIKAWLRPGMGLLDTVGRVRRGSKVVV